MNPDHIIANKKRMDTIRLLLDRWHLQPVAFVPVLELEQYRKDTLDICSQTPELFDMCTKMQKLFYLPVANPNYKRHLQEYIIEVLEILQTAPN